MKKLLTAFAVVAMSLGIMSQAHAYYTAGVMVENGECSVNTSYSQDVWWYERLGIEEFDYEGSLTYHRMRDNGNNFSAAAVCWMEEYYDWGAEDLDGYISNYLGYNLSNLWNHIDENDSAHWPFQNDLNAYIMIPSKFANVMVGPQFSYTPTEFAYLYTNVNQTTRDDMNAAWDASNMQDAALLEELTADYLDY